MPQKTTIQSIMPKGVFTVEYSDTIHKADLLMHNENIRHVPVVSDGKYIGMITERKINDYKLKHLYDFNEDEEVSGQLIISDFEQIINKDFPLIYPEDSVVKATELMAKKKVDALPVVDWEKNLVGIITSIDLLLFFHKKSKEEI
jgi:CBS domain-containing protein